jgi:hypothetical protein
VRIARIEPRFVELVPEALEPGLLYVSLEHGTMVHLCACGCANEVVLPLTPVDWRLTYDGENVSLWPSVGSWSLPCRSHYVVTGGGVRWAGDWTDAEIEAGRRRDRSRRAERLAAGADLGEPWTDEPAAQPETPLAHSRSVTADPGPISAQPRRGGIRGWLDRLFGA